MSGFRSFVNGCITKKPYRTLAYAEKRIAQVKKLNGTILRAYCCDVCGNFHVTKRPLDVPAAAPAPKPTQIIEPKPFPPKGSLCASGTKGGHPCNGAGRHLVAGKWYCPQHQHPNSHRPVTAPEPDRPTTLITSCNAVGRPRIIQEVGRG